MDPAQNEFTMTMPSRFAKRRGGSRGSHADRVRNDKLEDVLRQRGVDEAWNHLEEMQLRGATTSKFTVSRMLAKTIADDCVRRRPGRVYRAISLVEKFIEIQPKDIDEVLFNALLDTCCRLKNLTRLESTVQRMSELNISPSPVTLGILVKAYGQTGDMQKVLQVWNDMKDLHKQANAVTFGCMLDACVRCGNLQKAVEVFGEMKETGRHRNTILYTTLIKGYGLEKNLECALELFKEMPSEGVQRNTITFNSLIDVCIKCGDLFMAEAILREMTESTSTVEPDLITFSTLLKGYCQFAELDKALQVLEAIKIRGLHCDELVYNTLMDGCVKVNDIALGLGLFEEMIRNGLRPSAITHSILERLHQRAGCHDGKISEAIAQLYGHYGFVHSSQGDRSANCAPDELGSTSKWKPRLRRKRGGQCTKKAQAGISLSPQSADIPTQVRTNDTSTFDLQECTANGQINQGDVIFDHTNEPSICVDGQMQHGSEVPSAVACAPLFNVVWCSPTIGADQHTLNPTPVLKFAPATRVAQMHGLQAMPFVEPVWPLRLGGA